MLKILCIDVNLLYFSFIVIGDGVEFYDNETVYHFIFDVDIHFPLYQALNLGANDPASFKGTERRMSRLSMQDVDKKFLSKFWKGNLEGPYVGDGEWGRLLVENRHNISFLSRVMNQGERITFPGHFELQPLQVGAFLNSYHSCYFSEKGILKDYFQIRKNK